MSANPNDQPWVGYNGLSNAANIASLVGFAQIFGVVKNFSLEAAVAHLRQCHRDVTWQYDAMIKEQVVEEFDIEAFKRIKASMTRANQMVDTVVFKVQGKGFLRRLAPATGKLREKINIGLHHINGLNMDIITISRKARVGLALVPADAISVEDGGGHGIFSLPSPFQLGNNSTPAREPDELSLVMYSLTTTPIPDGEPTAALDVGEGPARIAFCRLTPDAGPSGLSISDKERLHEHQDVNKPEPMCESALGEDVIPVLFVELSMEPDDSSSAPKPSESAIQNAVTPAAGEAVVTPDSTVVLAETVAFAASDGIQASGGAGTKEIPRSQCPL